MPDASWPPLRQRRKEGDNQFQTGDVTHNEISTQVHDTGTSADEDRIQDGEDPFAIETGEEMG